MYLMEFSMFPVGQGESLSPYVARCLKLVRQSGLPHQLNAMGTVVEGELHDLLPLLERCFDELRADCSRISCSVKFDYRQGRSDRIASKVAGVEARLNA